MGSSSSNEFLLSKNFQNSILSTVGWRWILEAWARFLLLETYCQHLNRDLDWEKTYFDCKSRAMKLHETLVCFSKTMEDSESITKYTFATYILGETRKIKLSKKYVHVP